MKPIVLIDGHNLLFRYFQGMPRTIFSTDGRLLHGAYGMIAAVLRVAQQFEPTALLVCFDSPIQSDRVADLPSYKANRELAFAPEDPNNPFTQLDVIREALDALAIPWLEQAGIEADDLIGSYARAAGDQEVIIVSTDRDYLQLVSETTWLLVRRGKDEKRFTPDLVQQTFGITPKQYVDFKALTGDTSDNIRGVPGVGVKTAASLLQRYGTVDVLYDHLSEQTPRLTEALRTNRDLVFMNRGLITIRTGIPVDHQLLETFSSQTIKEVSVRQIFIRLGLFAGAVSPHSAPSQNEQAILAGKNGG